MCQFFPPIFRQKCSGTLPFELRGTSREPLYAIRYEGAMCQSQEHLENKVLTVYGPDGMAPTGGEICKVAAVKSVEDTFIVTFPPNVDAKTKGMFVCASIGIGWVAFRNVGQQGGSDFHNGY